MNQYKKLVMIALIFPFLKCASVGEKYVEAAADGNISEMEALSQKNGDLTNAREDRNWTALIAASSLGKIDIVKYLVKKKAKLNLRTNLGDTAIYRASANGHTDIVKFLLESGANPNIRDKKGDSCLIKASSKGHTDVMRVLLDARINPNEIRIPNIDATTPIIAAAAEDRIEAIKLLIKYKADINARNHNGDSALSIAASLGRIQAIRLLIVSGANLNNVSLFGLTPLNHAEENGFKEIVLELQKAGAKE